MIFVDSNVPMYLIGGTHAYKARAQLLLEELINQRKRLVTSAEVLQEICHRYSAIKRSDLLQPCFDTLYGIVDQVFPVTREDVEASKTLLLGYQGLSARDALHAATIRNLGIKEIISFDSDFDQFAWMSRIS